MPGGKNGPRAQPKKAATKQGQPTKKKQAVPKARTSRRTAPRSGFPHLSPLNPSVIPTVRCTGKSLPVSAVVHDELTKAMGDRVMYLVSNTGMSGTLMVKLTSLSGSQADPAKTAFTCQVIAAPSVYGGPTSGRAMKAGATIINNTPMLDSGGRVYILNTDQRLALPDDLSALTLTEFDTLCNTVKQSPQRRVYDGTDFKSPRHFHTHVTDPIVYETFRSWDGTHSVATFGAYIAEYIGGPDERRKSMSTLIILMEPAAKQQDYTVTARGMWSTRWPLNSIGAFVSKELPTASAAAIDRSFKDGAATANPPPK